MNNEQLMHYCTGTVAIATTVLYVSFSSCRGLNGVLVQGIDELYSVILSSLRYSTSTSWKQTCKKCPYSTSIATVATTVQLLWAGRALGD